MSSGDPGTDPLGGLRGRVDPIVRRALSRSFDLGFLGSMPLDDQVDHALGFVVTLEDRHAGPPRSVIDLGTGGGVPGLVMVSCWPDSRVVLMDASERRTVFLSETLEGRALGANAEIVRGRAEDLGRDPRLREQFDAVTARSFGPPPLVAECGSAFLGVGGWMVVSEPPDEVPAARWPADGLARVGVVPMGTTRVAGRYGYQVLHKSVAIDERFPRRVGVPTKRPLF